MPRRTSHPVSTWLRSLGWAGSSDEMTTPAGDVIQLQQDLDAYDPPFDSFGFTAPSQLPPPAGQNARFRFYFDDDVVAYRLRYVVPAFDAGLAQNGLFLRSVAAPEVTTDPLVALEPMWKSQPVAVPFRAREDTLPANPTHGFFVAGQGANGAHPGFGLTPSVWIATHGGRIALEIVAQLGTTQMRPCLLLDVLRPL